MTSIDNRRELSAGGNVELQRQQMQCNAELQSDQTQPIVEMSCGDEDALFVLAGQLREKVRAITLELGIVGLTPAAAGPGSQHKFETSLLSDAVYSDDPDQT